jgi:hypothetical protein
MGWAELRRRDVVHGGGGCTKHAPAEPPCPTLDRASDFGCLRLPAFQTSQEAAQVLRHVAVRARSHQERRPATRPRVASFTLVRRCRRARPFGGASPRGSP